MLDTIKKLFIEILFPGQCVHCSAPGQWFCVKCFNQIILNSSGPPEAVKGLNHVFVATDLNDITRSAIYTFKYNFVQDLGEDLGRILIKFLEQKIDQHYLLDFDLVVPVPLSKKKKLKRGFNQSEILATTVCHRFGWRLEPKLLHRRHHAKSQIDLGHHERFENVKDIFTIASGQSLKGKKILIIDDILTTGATISECAKVLKQAGAKEVWGLILAKNQSK